MEDEAVIQRSYWLPASYIFNERIKYLFRKHKSGLKWCLLQQLIMVETQDKMGNQLSSKEAISAMMSWRPASSKGKPQDMHYDRLKKREKRMIRTAGDRSGITLQRYNATDKMTQHEAGRWCCVD